MRRILIASLLLVATSAYADHIWRLWCGNPPTPRKGIFDSSAECHVLINRTMRTYGSDCVDTIHGMVWKQDGSPIEGDSETCRVNHDDWASCYCEPEAVETK